MSLFDKLVFVINLKKSQIVPTQRIRILGFVINSVKMIVTLTQEKKHKLKTLILNLYRINKPTIRYLAKVIGIIIFVCELQYLDLTFIVIWKIKK